MTAQIYTAIYSVSSPAFVFRLLKKKSFKLGWDDTSSGFYLHFHQWFVICLDICILSDLCIIGSFFYVFVCLKILLRIPTLPGTNYEVQTDLVLVAATPSGCQDYRCVPHSSATVHFNYGLFGLFLLLSWVHYASWIITLTLFRGKFANMFPHSAGCPFFYSVGCFLDCTEFPNLRWFIFHL